ncbi:restriction endonuclease subunit S [Flavobacterium sp. GNP002]
MSTITLHIERKITSVPKLRFPEFDEEWENSVLNKFASLNPKNSSLPESFVYIDLESVTDGHLVKENIISKNEAPSRAQRVLKEMDILYQTVRPYQKNNLYFNKVGHYVASTGYAQIRTKNDSQFLFQFLHTEKFVANVMLRCTGTSYPAINSTDLSSIEIFFPTLPEQQKIASFLNAVDEKIQQLSRKKELLEQYKKGVMQQLFSGKLRFKDENGKDYPDWEEKKLGDVCDVRDGTHDSPKYVDKGFPFITSKNLMKNGSIDFENVSFINELDYNKVNQRSKVNINDILFGMIGTIGNPVLVKSEGFAIKNVALIKEKKDLLNLFLIHFLKGDSINQQFFEQNTGGTQKFLSLSVIRNLIAIVPSLPEQQKIANFLSGIDSKIEQVNGELVKTQEFKKGLLQQMFL